MTTQAQIANDLTASVETATVALRKLTPEQVAERPSPDRWTIKQVIGHLIDSAANNHQRFIRAQFVDELVFPKYDQNQWVDSQQYDATEWDDLVELWRRYNLHLAHVVRNVRTEALAVRCLIGHYEPMTLDALIEDYVVHMRHHLTKIAERVGAKPAEFGS
jgi:hypothetical protein